MIASSKDRANSSNISTTQESAVNSFYSHRSPVRTNKYVKGICWWSSNNSNLLELSYLEREKMVAVASKWDSQERRFLPYLLTWELSMRDWYRELRIAAELVGFLVCVQYSPSVTCTDLPARIFWAGIWILSSLVHARCFFVWDGLTSLPWSEIRFNHIQNLEFKAIWYHYLVDAGIVDWEDRMKK